MQLSKISDISFEKIVRKKRKKYKKINRKKEQINWDELWGTYAKNKTYYLQDSYNPNIKNRTVPSMKITMKIKNFLYKILKGGK